MAQAGAFCRVRLFHVARNLLLDRLRINLASARPRRLTIWWLSPRRRPILVERLGFSLPRVLAELAVEDRTAIVTCDLEGASQKDYAARSGLTLAAAKSRLLRARQRLRPASRKASMRLGMARTGRSAAFYSRARRRRASRSPLKVVAAPRHRGGASF